MTDTAKGPRCRACGCRHLPVIKTRPAPRDRVMRIRECRNCGTKQVTYEAAAGADVDSSPLSIEDLTEKQRDSLVAKLFMLLGLR